MYKWRILFGIALTVTAIAVFLNKRIAIQEDITLNVVESQDTPALMPGDCLRQDMYMPYGHVESISVAFSYRDGLPQETQALVAVTAEGETVMSQALSVAACENRSFVDFYVNMDGCRGKTVTISVSNVTPEDISGGEFALMATDREDLFIDEAGVCEINGEKTGSSIFCRAACIKGYSYYQAATWAFLILLAGGVIMEKMGGRHPYKRSDSARSDG